MQVNIVKSEDATYDISSKKSYSSIEEENLIIEQAKKIIGQRMFRDAIKIGSMQDIADYLILHTAQIEHETFSIVFLDNKNYVIECKQMFSGTIDKCAIYTREIVKHLLKINAARVIISHNHASGYPSPSAADKFITTHIQQALSLIDVEVVDHIIIGARDFYSFAQNGLI